MARLGMKERSLLENMPLGRRRGGAWHRKHVLVAYKVEVEGDGREAVARLAAESSTGVGHDVCAQWPPLAESLGAVVYHWEPEQQAGSSSKGPAWGGRT